MIAAFDVHYPADGSAWAAAVLFTGFTDSHPERSYRQRIAGVEPYRPGSFSLRELPCILQLLAGINEPLETIVIDGYVTLGDRPGLGQRLRETIGADVTVIGVAKNFFAGSRPARAFRGRSGRPLYITAQGIGAGPARTLIESMHGGFRIPTLLRIVDHLARGLLS